MLLGYHTTFRARCSPRPRQTTLNRPQYLVSTSRVAKVPRCCSGSQGATFNYCSCSSARPQHTPMEPIAEQPGVKFNLKAGQANAGKLRSSKDEVSIAKKQLEEKEDPTEEEIDAELLLARTSNNSKRSLQRSFGFRSKKEIAVGLPGTGAAANAQQ